VGGTVGGVLGAIVAVPVMAGITVVLERMQDREIPVPIDPAAVETPDEEAVEDQSDDPATPAPRRRRKPSPART